MRNIFILILSISLCNCMAYAQTERCKSATVAFNLDHNRMLIEAEMQKKDGSWRKVRLWIDSGSPDFFISETLARDLGIDISAAEDSTFNKPSLDIETPNGLRIGSKLLNMNGVKTSVKFQPFWLFSTMHCDGNLPSSVLKKYDIIFDYPKHEFCISDPGIINKSGNISKAIINPKNGIVQLNALIDGNNFNFALDMGASYSFISENKLSELLSEHKDWPKITGTTGCANMWGWWPANENLFSVVRIPEMTLGNLKIESTGIVGVPNFPHNGKSLGEWYSSKTANPVDGFIGANVLKHYRIIIDYLNSNVYFEKGEHTLNAEMDIVGISIKQLPDSNYQVAGIVRCDTKYLTPEIEPNDIILSIDDFPVKGATMGTVVDKLRGKPGELRKIEIERKGKKMIINAKVEHFL